MNTFAKEFAIKAAHLNVLEDVQKTDTSFVFIFAEKVDVKNITQYVMVLVEISDKYACIIRSTDYKKPFELFHVVCVSDTTPAELYDKLIIALTKI